MRYLSKVYFLPIAVIVISALGIGCGGSGGASTDCQNYSATASCSDNWAELAPTGTKPDIRYLASVAYDTANDSMILFGGTDGTTFYNDTFVLSNVSGDASATWTTLSPTGTAPTGRYASAVVYNSTSNELAVYGGTNTTTIMTDLYILSNANGTGTPSWSSSTISGTAPSSRAHFASAYDEANDTLIIFGGKNCSSTSCTLSNEVWTLTSVTGASPTWVKLSPSGTGPSARSYASAVYDATLNRLIIFGGNTSTDVAMAASSAQSDTWVLSNANGTGGTAAWSALSPSTTPSERFGHTAVYDTTNDRMMIFGGIDLLNTALNETWILADSNTATPSWTRYVTCANTPAGRGYQSAIYTGITLDSMAIFGGEIGGGTNKNDTWVLSSANANFSTNASSVTVTSGSAEICTTNTTQLVVSASSSGTELSDFLYTCTSSNPSVATVDSEGLVTGVAAGTATITVTVDDIPATYGVTVTSSGGTGDSCSPQASTCCTTSGGVQVVGVMCPTGECADNTTFSVHDATYDMDLCSCNGC